MPEIGVEGSWGIWTQDLSGVPHISETPASIFPLFLCNTFILKLSHSQKLIREKAKSPPFDMGESPSNHCESSPQVALAQSTFDNPEWFYRHVDAHSLCCEYQAVSKDNHVVLCGWKGRATHLL